MPHKPYGPYEKYIKRPLDCILSGIAIVFLSPVMLVIAVLVRVKLGSPIFFSQERIGLNEKSFRLYKFRSMTDERDENGTLLPDEKRLTPFGSALRSTSLDELLELFSIVKGDMAIVGPRPMPTYYLPYFKEEERVIHTVRGGLIPPDVLTLRSVLDWNEQFQNETNYANKITFLMDMKIIISTFIILFKRNKDNYGEVVRTPLNEERAYMQRESTR